MASRQLGNVLNGLQQFPMSVDDVWSRLLPLLTQDQQDLMQVEVLNEILNMPDQNQQRNHFIHFMQRNLNQQQTIANLTRVFRNLQMAHVAEYLDDATMRACAITERLQDEPDRVRQLVQNLANSMLQTYQQNANVQFQQYARHLAAQLEQYRNDPNVCNGNLPT